jgi:amino acid transporter
MIPELTHWESYYVIVGSSAAALTGLQFVVVALINESPRAPTSARAVAAYGSPTIVHFCMSLTIAAIITAPWTSMAGVSVTMALLGLANIGYDFVVFRRAHKQEEYKPEISDWIWHTMLPLVAHATLMFAAISLLHSPVGSLFAVAVSALLLLFIGIHNAWDSVTYIAVVRPSLQADTERKSGPRQD